jgi:hypothetical protein
MSDFRNFPTGPLDIHRQLTIAFEALMEFPGAGFTAAVSVDTVFACGEALGIVMKAKALASRDVDDMKKALAQDNK